MSNNHGIPDDIIRYKALLKPAEFEAYQKMLKEIEKNKEYYLAAEPREMARCLISKCQIKAEYFYNIMNTIKSTEELNW